MTLRLATPLKPALLVAASAVLFAAAGGSRAGFVHPATAQPFPIQHIIVIMQENRSFDSYFGTYPGADGIPMQNGVPAVCVPDRQSGTCVAPYHDPNDQNAGGPHGAAAARDDIDQGKMDGFIAQQQAGRRQSCNGANNPACTEGGTLPDAMGYHDQREIPNYWAYAQNFVLQDHMFEPNASWSLPAHLFTVSAWSARCTSGDPMSCTNELQTPGGSGFLFGRPNRRSGQAPLYSWTDITYLLHNAGVNWGY